MIKDVIICINTVVACVVAVREGRGQLQEGTFTAGVDELVETKEKVSVNRSEARQLGALLQ